MDVLSIVFVIVIIALIPTAYAAKIGAPWVPTFKPALDEAFSFINLGADDTLIDIGAGDGKVVALAAKRGAKAYGYELSPIMWAVAVFRTMTTRRAKVYFGNFYKKKLNDATVVFAFLMPQNMDRVRKYLADQEIPNGKYFLSYTFSLKDIEPFKVIRVPKCGPVYVYNLKELTKPATI